MALQDGTSLDQGLEPIFKSFLIVWTPTLSKRGKKGSLALFSQKLRKRLSYSRPIWRGLPRTLFLENEAVDVVGKRSDGTERLNRIKAKGYHCLKLFVKSLEGGRT